MNRRLFVSGVTAALAGVNTAEAFQAKKKGSRSVSTAGRLKKVADIDVYRDARYYCGPGPSPIVFPDGRILLAFRRTLEAGHFHPEVEMCLLTSNDGGRTWPGTPEVFDFGAITNP